MWCVKKRLMNAQGFTLIEMLLVSTLVLAISVTISSSLIQGSRMFERLVSIQGHEAAAFFFGKNYT